MIKKEVITAVEQWAEGVGIRRDTDPKPQLVVMTEECAEYDKEPENPMEFGDTLVTIITTGRAAGVNLEVVFQQLPPEEDVVLSFGLSTLLLRHLGNIGNAIRKEKDVESALKDFYRDLLVVNRVWLSVSAEECLRMAYDKISKRSGKMIGGTFVKEQDL